jgi:hypothetical protein
MLIAGQDLNLRNVRFMSVVVEAPARPQRPLYLLLCLKADRPLTAQTRLIGGYHERGPDRGFIAPLHTALTSWEMNLAALDAGPRVLVVSGAAREVPRSR